MNEIISGDDEVDLCRRSKVFSQERAVLTGLILVVFSLIMFQQMRVTHFSWNGSFRWAGSVAYADDNSRIKNVCALKKNFADTLRGSDAHISLVKDQACDREQKVSPPVDVTSLEQEIAALVSEYPIAAMVPAIAQQDRMVAAFLVGIAKKESDWGKHAPTKNGSDCYNYWGYKGKGGRGDAEGYACFVSPEEAVQAVGDRLSTLAHTQNRDTPAKMLVWKCGASCAGHTPESVSSWIGGVNTYYIKIISLKRG